MSYLSGIGFNNFRVFGEQTDFKFAPITILTGTNNSGKSSLIKGLLLLKDYFGNFPKGTNTLDPILNFKGSEHHLGGINFVRNDIENEVISFTFPFAIPIIANSKYQAV